MTFVECVGDLFSVEPEWALAHCVGSDFVMGAGIAKEFRDKYGNVDWLLENSRGVGTALLLMHEDRNIFYLITKKRSRYEKPTYANIEAAVVDMFGWATGVGITQIAMPRIGCGLDGKKWETIRGLLERHQPETVDVRVYHP